MLVGVRFKLVIYWDETFFILFFMFGVICCFEDWFFMWKRGNGWLFWDSLNTIKGMKGKCLVREMCGYGEWVEEFI